MSRHVVLSGSQSVGDKRASEGQDCGGNMPTDKRVEEDEDWAQSRLTLGAEGQRWNTYPYRDGWW